MTHLLFAYHGKTLRRDDGHVVPRVGDEVVLVDRKYLSKSDSGQRRFRVGRVTHQPSLGQIQIDVEYVGLP